MATFGELLKEFRVARKVTLGELGKFIGKSIGYIADIERGRKGPPDLDTVSKIEDYLRIEDGKLIAIARGSRPSAIRSLASHIRQKPQLSAVLMRVAEDVPKEKYDELLETIKKLRG